MTNDKPKATFGQTLTMIVLALTMPPLAFVYIAYLMYNKW
jgi:hypothetical protein